MKNAVVMWQHRRGRRTRESRADLTATTWSYRPCADYGCLNASNKMVIVESALNAAGTVISDQRVYTDQLDRPMATSARALSGAYTRISREYDALGRLYRQSAPCWWSGCTPFWTTVAYDDLNRITEVSRPVSDSDASLQTTYTYYEGLTTRTLDALSKESTKVANAVGGLARSADHDNYYQSFDYDPFGNVLRVTDSLGYTLLTNTFNLRGMRTAQNDLAAGSWSYTPNALGEVVSQTDANSQTTTFGYDRLGRLTSRTEPEGTSTFTFGTSATANNIGRLASMSGPGYSEGFTYDSIGRLQQRTIASDAAYQIDYEYNEIGALHALTYPTSTSGYRLKLQYDYQYGHLMRVKDFNTPATVFWTANGTDARGAVIDETLGNGVQTIRGYDQVTGQIDYIQSTSPAESIQNLNHTWDRVGNLTQRQDVRAGQGLTENFYYDNLHRLTSTTGPDPISIDYDARGNIISRTGDLSSGASHTITWTTYNLPDTISASANNSSQFFYAPDRSRWKQVASYGGTSEQTIYIGGLIEKVTLGTTTSWKHYIAGGSGMVAVYTRKSAGADEIHYLTQDHLGSIDSVTDASGAVEARLSYGALGQRRNEDTWSGNPTSGDWAGITDTTRRGFTSHEMLDNLNLTHMNGRVYDQLIGRFTSPDPFIDGAGRTSGWNRYSYVHNNPLSFVDPSGFTEVIKSWINGPDEPDPNADSYTYNGFMDMARGGFMGLQLGSSGPRPDLWSLRRFFDVPRPDTLPWPDWNSPPADRPIPAPHGLGNGGESTVGGYQFAAPNEGTWANPFTLVEPPGLKALRNAHPSIDLVLEALWVASFRGETHEEGALFYRNRLTGTLFIDAYSYEAKVNPRTGLRSFLGPRYPGLERFPEYEGYDLVLTVHTHPWETANAGNVLCRLFPSCFDGRGPSVRPDIETASRYPNAFHMILGLSWPFGIRESYYYGPKAAIDE